ncbi:polysaccharide pyruvyl transferase family protein [Pelagicoccus enzymogenes]|uniref:polysaccharide pyruvyl transferase family protein n=1 Tax=Pelagicoccus enzymogenes TaxID=2773457 RepID=UPI00280E6615|nr:polysaccharide pyruvyl transferase family protein [Pelagicoccus enzymogenes]MDQ8201096.1 polysaccharide pyruvyl transferase family protein [Pelagicoccus enzymogenes]
MSTNTITIFHSHAHQNYGDLLMLKGVCKWVKQHNSQTHICILSMKGMELEFSEGYDSHWQFQDFPMPYKRGSLEKIVQKISRKTRSSPHIAWKARSTAGKGSIDCMQTGDRQSTEELLKQSSLLIFTGNGYLNDSYPFHVILAEALSSKARELGIPAIATGQGIGPIHNKTLQNSISKHLRNCRYAWTRDPLSSTESKSVIKHEIECIGDDALLSLKPKQEEDQRSSKFRILINHRLRDRHNKATNQQIAKVVETVSKIDEAEITCVIMESSEEKNWNEIRKNLPNSITLNYFRPLIDDSSLESTFSEAALCIGISYHFCLLSAHFGRATIGLYESDYYYRKLTGLAKHYPNTSMQVMTYEDASKKASEFSNSQRENLKRNTDLENRVVNKYRDTFSKIGLQTNEI